MSPLQALASLTPLAATQGRSAGSLGVVPIGVYKGAAAFWDLDAAVNQPLVQAELAHILGKLDGREEGYDLRTVTVTLAALANQAFSGQLAVPAGQVWFVTGIRTTLPASGGANIIAGNWQCDLWTDRSGTPSPLGQAWYPLGLNLGVMGGNDTAEFHPGAPFFAIDNKPVALRLPAGKKLTFTVINTVGVAGGAVAATLEVFGYVGKTLVA